MLVLSRKKEEKIIIGDQITVVVIEIRGDKVRLGIDAPKDITIHRQEVYEAIQRENAAVKKCAICGWQSKTQVGIQQHLLTEHNTADPDNALAID